MGLKAEIIFLEAAPLLSKYGFSSFILVIFICSSTLGSAYWLDG
ncbi:hypothetical protein V6Z12_D07G260400 [Gossypium hirsutum]